MLFRKDLKCSLRKLFIIVALLFVPLFIVLRGNNVNAWQLTDSYFDGTQSLNIFRSYMEQADGAPYIVNDEHLGIVGPASSYVLLPVTDSTIQTKTLFGFTTAGYNLSGDDSTKRYHSAQAIFYFNLSNSSYISFGNVDIEAHYILYNPDSGAVQTQSSKCSLSYTQDINPPNTVYVDVECPQVTYKGTGWLYRWVDLHVGDVNNTTYDINSPYFVRYRNGGPFRISANVGQYIVSSSDNATELALEQISAQNQTIINQNQQMIDDSQEYYDKIYDSIDNISNQTSSDIQGSENQKTTDLITALGSLVGAFASIQPASDCNIQLDFPSYAGGSQVVNICQHKEKAPQIILIGSSVFLVIFALKYWNKMAIKIYKVIRSFIDGTDDTEGEE